jgi:hypothetical protein
MTDFSGQFEISLRSTTAHRAIGLLPPAWREPAAERLLRRDAPGPACEHVVQYLLSVARQAERSGTRKDATICHGADLFYEMQYRQYLNPVMGAFAMTATQALVACGGSPQGHLWRRYRKTFAAMLDAVGGAPPILVLDRETVAVAFSLPEAFGVREVADVEAWLSGRAAMPERLRTLVCGQEVRCANPGVSARERSADAAILEVVGAVLRTGRLALLALHPNDPDAMGLHLTLFCVEVASARRLEQDYGLAAAALEAYREAAAARGRLLFFLVGGTEEAFTQCSQNLFVKRAEPRTAVARASWPAAWDPRAPLQRLLAHQFEMIQVTVSSDGVPGASPRNGDLGKAGFVAESGKKLQVLIPYYPGNAVHGHAGKLWSNPYGTLVISDDHTALTRVTISGPARTISHAAVARKFREIAIAAETKPNKHSGAAALPEYWFLQDVAEIVQEAEPLAPNRLDPQRPTCSINAGGRAEHGKKPAYFAADTLPLYDRQLQHQRETAGRPICRTGRANRSWLEQVAPALAARREHLARVRGDPSPAPAPRREPVESTA